MSHQGLNHVRFYPPADQRIPSSSLLAVNKASSNRLVGGKCILRIGYGFPHQSLWKVGYRFHWTAVVADACTNSWVLYPGQANTPLYYYWVQQGVAGQYTEESCKAACALLSSCQAVDYNTRLNTCWAGSGILSYGSVPNPDVNHWEITRLNCDGKQLLAKMT